MCGVCSAQTSRDDRLEWCHPCCSARASRPCHEQDHLKRHGRDVGAGPEYAILLCLASCPTIELAAPAYARYSEIELLLHGMQLQVVKRLWAYIKENDLQNPKDKRKIVLDDKLSKLFKPPLTMFTINKQLSRHCKVQGEPLRS